MSLKETSVLILSVFIAGLCSIIYELLIGTASSYFLGDSVKQFSITIGLYMVSMGAGSFVSRFIQTNLLSKFIAIEIVLGFIGGSSVPASRIRMNPGAIKIRVPTKYVEDRIIGNFFVFAKDLIDKSPQPSTLDRPMVLSYYLEGWRYWN